MADDKVLRDAQYRKGLGIGFFNATNSAIALVAAGVGDKLPEVEKIRDYLIEQHKEYYAKNIANIGKNYDAKTTIERLNATESMEDLHRLWIILTEDERRDGEILKAKDALKKKYEKA